MSLPRLLPPRHTSHRLSYTGSDIDVFDKGCHWDMVLILWRYEHGQFELSTQHDLELPRNRVSMKDCLDQVGLQLYLWWATLSDVGKPRLQVGGTISEVES